MASYRKTLLLLLRGAQNVSTCAPLCITESKPNSPTKLICLTLSVIFCFLLFPGTPYGSDDLEPYSDLYDQDSGRLSLGLTTGGGFGITKSLNSQGHNQYQYIAIKAIGAYRASEKISLRLIGGIKYTFNGVPFDTESVAATSEVLPSFEFSLLYHFTSELTWLNPFFAFGVHMDIIHNTILNTPAVDSRLKTFVPTAFFGLGNEFQMSDRLSFFAEFYVTTLIIHNDLAGRVGALVYF